MFHIEHTGLVDHQSFLLPNRHQRNHSSGLVSIMGESILSEKHSTVYSKSFKNPQGQIHGSTMEYYGKYAPYYTIVLTTALEYKYYFFI